jgi:hypothetical protein
MRIAEKIELDAQAERELRILSKRRRVEVRSGPTGRDRSPVPRLLWRTRRLGA